MKEYDVHKALITGRSEFFARALNGKWKESDEATVTLPEAEETFETYLELLYTNTLPLEDLISIYINKEQQVKKAEEDFQREINEAAGQEYKDMCTLYIFCNRVQDTTSKNLILTAMVEQINKRRADGRRHHPGKVQINLVYDGTMPGDCMRKLLVDIHVWRGSEFWFKGQNCDSYPAEFLWDYALRMRQAVDQKFIDKHKKFKAADYLERDGQKKDLEGDGQKKNQEHGNA
jgi:hypothetical protein